MVLSVQGHRLPLLQELWPYQSLFFFQPLVTDNQKASLASLSLQFCSFRHIEGPPWLGSYSVDQYIRHLKGYSEWGPTL